jgi:hypothetical protein
VEGLQATSLTNATEETLYGKVMELADAALSRSSQRLLRYAILSRYYSPKALVPHTFGNK